MEGGETESYSFPVGNQSLGPERGRGEAGKAEHGWGHGTLTAGQEAEKGFTWAKLAPRNRAPSHEHRPRQMGGWTQPRNQGELRNNSRPDGVAKECSKRPGKCG